MADLPARSLSGELSEPEENEDLLEAALARRGGDVPEIALAGEADPDPAFPLEGEEGEEGEEGVSDSEYQKMRQKICHDAMINTSGFDLFNEAEPGGKVQTMFDCGPGASAQTLLDITHRYIHERTMCRLMVGMSPRATEALLEETNFPLHAVILSGLGHTMVKDMQIKLQDIRGLPSADLYVDVHQGDRVPAQCILPPGGGKIRELLSFIHMQQPALSKLRAAKHLGITEPAVSFLVPLSKPDDPPQDQVFTIGNLAHEDLMILLQEKTLESFMGALAWPQVHHSLTGIRERIGLTD